MDDSEIVNDHNLKEIKDGVFKCETCSLIEPSKEVFNMFACDG